MRNQVQRQGGFRFRFLIYRSAADFLRLRKRLVLWLFRLFNIGAIEPQLKLFSSRPGIVIQVSD